MTRNTGRGLAIFRTRLKSQSPNNKHDALVATDSSCFELNDHSGGLVKLTVRRVGFIVRRELEVADAHRSENHLCTSAGNGTRTVSKYLGFSGHLPANSGEFCPAQIFRSQQLMPNVRKDGRMWPRSVGVSGYLTGVVLRRASRPAQRLTPVRVFFPIDNPSRYSVNPDRIFVTPNHNPAINQRAITPISQTSMSATKTGRPFIPASVELDLMFKKLQVGGVEARLFQSQRRGGSVTNFFRQVRASAHNSDEDFADSILGEHLDSTPRKMPTVNSLM